ncbi:MAG: tetratricopeptide repeat protein [Gammaproteobacteria bacterium]|nr:tetratricopeptide repeat protein [Gammaproteobacteria bacterium]
MIRFYCHLFLLLFFLPTTQAYAFNIKPWFENINQRAARLLTEKKYAEAEKTFTRSDWRAVATYRGKDYDKASKQFKALGGDLGLYNQGNALAYLGQYQEAIDAYEKALKINPNNADAKYNRDLLKKLLKENPQEEKQQEQDKKDQDQKQQEQNKKDQKGKQQEQDKKDQDQKQQEQDKKNQDQKQQEQKRQEQNKKEQEQAQAQKQQDQKQQDQEQSLRLIPDDPGGLLREKFWRDHWRRLKAEQS